MHAPCSHKFGKRMNPKPPLRIPPSMSSHPDIPPVPDDLARRLRALHPPVPLPAHIDEAVLSHARRAATRRTWQRRVLIAAPLAAAAGLTIAVWVAWPGKAVRSLRVPPPSVASERAPQAPLAGDLNHDGTIDMLDALVLAQRIQRATPAPGDDQNKDGVIDTRDIDTLAMLAVDLGTSKGGGA